MNFIQILSFRLDNVIKLYTLIFNNGLNYFTTTITSTRTAFLYQVGI